jgi:NhaP-type Na+/H+ or K+/H+ antiporter
MQDSSLIYLLYLGIIILAGLIFTAVSKKIRIPSSLLLVLLGLLLANFTQFSFPPLFIAAFAVLALSVVAFDSSSRFNIHRLDMISSSAVSVFWVYLILTICVFSTLVWLIYPVSIPFAIMFATAVSGASSIMMFFFKGIKSKIFQFIEAKAIVSAPFIILIPFLILGFLDAEAKVVPFFREILIGVGTGVIVALIIFKLMHKHYNRILSPIAMVAGAVLTYLMAELLEGNGVLAVVALGLFFGNVHIANRQKIHYFSDAFKVVLGLLVFVLVGMLVKFPLSGEFIKTSLLLFAAFIAVRFFAIMLCLWKEKYTLKEKIFLSLSVGEGIELAVIAFALSVFNMQGLEQIIYLMIAFIVYSAVLSSIIIRFSGFFTGIDISSEKK